MQYYEKPTYNYFQSNTTYHYEPWVSYGGYSSYYYDSYYYPSYSDTYYYHFDSSGSARSWAKPSILKPALDSPADSEPAEEITETPLDLFLYLLYRHYQDFYLSGYKPDSLCWPGYEWWASYLFDYWYALPVDPDYPTSDEIDNQLLVAKALLESRIISIVTHENGDYEIELRTGFMVEPVKVIVPAWCYDEEPTAEADAGPGFWGALTKTWRDWLGVNPQE